MAELLLHSMSNFREIFNISMELKKPKRLVEIGSEYGGSTKVLLEYAKSNNAHLYIIDPMPYVDLDLELKEYFGYFTLIKELSVNALSELSNIDMYFIDGDHNYYTVSQELNHILVTNPNSWIFMHDVNWPWGYRDLYYNPKTIPENFLHEYTYTYSINERNEIDERGGFNGVGEFAFAKKFGGEKNGVKKAIEDIIFNNKNYFYNEISAVMGLGLIVPESDKEYSVNILKPYQNELINTLEKNRIELYIKHLQLIYKIEKEYKVRERNILFRISRKISNKINYRKFH